MATGGASSGGGAPTQQTKRLNRGLEEIRVNPLPFVRDLNLSFEDGLNRLTGIIVGPDGSDYAGGHFRFQIQFLTEYPFKPPDFFFTTAICHPNVDTRTGQACHEQLIGAWQPTISLRQVLSEMHSLLANPNYDTPIGNDPLNEKTPEKAREWTQSFAQP